jgi:hypothetical protein
MPSTSLRRTSRQNDALTVGQAAHIGTSVLVALGIQNAGYVLRLRVDAVVVMCGRVRCQRKAGRGGAVRSVNRVTVAKLTVGRGCAPPTVTQRTSLTPSSMLVWCVWRFYALQLVDEFSDDSGGVLVECAGSDRREDA